MVKPLETMNNSLKYHGNHQPLKDTTAAAPFRFPRTPRAGTAVTGVSKGVAASSSLVFWRDT